MMLLTSWRLALACAIARVLWRTLTTEMNRMPVAPKTALAHSRSLRDRLNYQLEGNSGEQVNTALLTEGNSQPKSVRALQKTRRRNCASKPACDPQGSYRATGA